MALHYVELLNAPVINSFHIDHLTALSCLLDLPLSLEQNNDAMSEKYSTFSARISLLGCFSFLGDRHSDKNLILLLYTGAILIDILHVHFLYSRGDLILYSIT